MKGKKVLLTVSTMNGLTDDYENVEFVIDSTLLKITLSNGRVIIYPLINVARICYKEN
jgi:hypothetical protein